MLEGPRINAVLLLIETSFAPLLFKVTAPVKLLLAPLVDRSIALAPALKLAVPGTVIVPDCEIAPFVVTDKLLPLAKVIAGKTRPPALSDRIVRLPTAALPPTTPRLTSLAVPALIAAVVPAVSVSA